MLLKLLTNVAVLPTTFVDLFTERAKLRQAARKRSVRFHVAVRAGSAVDFALLFLKQLVVDSGDVFSCCYVAKINSTELALPFSACRALGFLKHHAWRNAAQSCPGYTPAQWKGFEQLYCFSVVRHCVPLVVLQYALVL